MRTDKDAYLKILIIDNSVAYTGAFKCALNEAEMLSDDQHHFTFVLHDHSNLKKVVKEHGYTVHNLHMIEISKSLPIILAYPFMLLWNTIVLLKIVRDEEVDIIQVNDFYNLLGAMAKLFGFKGKLITYVRFLPSVMPAPLRKFWIKMANRFSHKVIAVSDAVLEQLPANSKTIRIYDPVMLKEEHPVKTYKKEEEPVKMLYLANFIKGKGQDYAIEAFAIAYKKHKKITLHLAGGDMKLEKNIEYREDLEQRVSELGLTEVVTFAKFSADVESKIKKADIVLNFSDAESFSMTCLEAAFYGTALIATKCGGPEEIISQGETGLLVPVKDINAMANAMITLANDANLREQYAIAGKNYVRNKFSTQEYLQQIKTVING